MLVCRKLNTSKSIETITFCKEILYCLSLGTLFMLLSVVIDEIVFPTTPTTFTFDNDKIQMDQVGCLSVRPDWAFYWTLGNFLKPLASITLPKSATFLGNFCKGVKIYHFSSEIIFGQLLQTFGNFVLVPLLLMHSTLQ